MFHLGGGRDGWNRENGPYLAAPDRGRRPLCSTSSKTGEPESVKRKYPASMKDKKLLAVYEDFCKEIFIEPKKWTADSTMTMFGDQLYRTPEEMVDFKGLRVLRPGLQMGEFKKNRFEPSHALALALHPSEVKQNVNLSATRRRRRHTCAARRSSFLRKTPEKLVPCECGRVFARMGQEERRDAEKPLSEGTAEAVLIEEGKILRHRSRKLHCFPSDRMPECHRIGVKRLPSDEAVIRVV